MFIINRYLMIGYERGILEVQRFVIHEGRCKILTAACWENIVCVDSEPKSQRWHECLR